MLTVAAYSPAFRAGFIWDDDDHLTNNPAMTSPDGLKQIWSSLRVSRYYPLTLTTFWVERRLWGLNPLPYHAVNIALQAANAVLLWLLLRQLKVPGAWAAAAVWAVHPVNVESVAWVTELKNLQSGLFFLLALLAFESELPVLATLCGVAAMLSKPSTVVLPAVMLLIAWWRERKDWRRVLPLAIAAIAMSVLTIVEQRQYIASENVLSFAQRLMLAGRAVWFYAGKLVWPDVCFMYPRWSLRADWLPLAGLLVVAGILWRFRPRPVIFGVGYFVIALLPVLGFFNIYYFRYSYVADHFQYLASIGLIALAAKLYRKVWVLPFILLVLTTCTWRQCHAYRDLEALWSDTVEKNPSAWLAHNNLAVVLQKQGRLPEVLEHYEQTVRLKPDFAEAQYNLGVALAASGRTDEAIPYWQEAVRLKPGFAAAEHNLDVAAPIRIEGQTSNVPAAVGIESFEVFHASKTNGLGYTYNHHVDMACWKGRLYVAWTSAEKDEDTWPWHEMYSTSTDGKTWSEPAELFPQGTSTPLRMYFFRAPDGRMFAIAGKYKGQTKLKESDKTELVIREILPDHTLGPVTNDCRQLYENQTFLEQQDHGSLLGDRRMNWHELKERDMDLQALMFFHRKDGALVGIAKKRNVIISHDEGMTWSRPVKPPSLITGRAKVWGQHTPEGRYVLVYNPDPTNRFPLVMVTGDDGITFRNMQIINGDLPPKRFEGEHKNIGPQYVRGISEWATDHSRDDAGFWIVYSMNKEDIWVSHILPATISGRQ